MSARDPYSILYKGNKSSGQATGKIERLRAGKVPEWAKNNSDKPNSQSAKGAHPSLKTSTEAGPSKTGLKFTGMTADASAVIVDTSRGQKNTEAILQEKIQKINDGEVVKYHE